MLTQIFCCRGSPLGLKNFQQPCRSLGIVLIVPNDNMALCILLYEGDITSPTEQSFHFGLFQSCCTVQHHSMCTLFLQLVICAFQNCLLLVPKYPARCSGCCSMLEIIDSLQTSVILSMAHTSLDRMLCRQVLSPRTLRLKTFHDGPQYYIFMWKNS